MRIHKTLILISLILTSCLSKKEVKHFPEIIPPFLTEEINIEEVFVAKEKK